MFLSIITDRIRLLNECNIGPRRHIPKDVHRKHKCGEDPTMPYICTLSGDIQRDKENVWPGSGHQT